MPDWQRFHDGASIDAGFQAGYEWDPRMQVRPECPPGLTRRQRRRWAVGFRDGCDARVAKAAVDRQKAIRGEREGARYDLLAMEWRRLLLDQERASRPFQDPVAC